MDIREEIYGHSRGNLWTFEFPFERNVTGISLLCDVNYATMDELSSELLIHYSMS